MKNDQPAASVTKLLEGLRDDSLPLDVAGLALLVIVALGFCDLFAAALWIMFVTHVVCGRDRGPADARAQLGGDRIDQVEDVIRDWNRVE